ALGMVATMKMENHTAIINTAAASNLGQMLLKVCKADGIPLINIVRKKKQVDLLKSIGGEYILNSSDNDFKAKLIDAITETGATLAFECIGGGDMAGQILDAMEKALASKADNYSVYGTTTLKQIYIYGSLNQAPTTFSRSFGLYWNIGGWLVSPIIQKLGVEGFMTMQKRVADEIHTTFKSNFHKSISLEQVCEPDHILEYVKAGSGKKYLVKPQLS
ncbi:MAG: zinc-binding dehydrogenase, partial [Saprospiraceae bacterium]|nr:zinc-binding dehydrogenase [Saprospiraceae bacterium]